MVDRYRQNTERSLHGYIQVLARHIGKIAECIFGRTPNNVCIPCSPSFRSYGGNLAGTFLLSIELFEFTTISTAARPQSSPLGLPPNLLDLWIECPTVQRIKNSKMGGAQPFYLLLQPGTNLKTQAQPQNVLNNGYDFHRLVPILIPQTTLHICGPGTTCVACIVSRQ